MRRGLLLTLALALALWPLEILVDPEWARPVVLCSLSAVLGVGMLARLVLPRWGLATITQLLVVVLGAPLMATWLGLAPVLTAAGRPITQVGPLALLDPRAWPGAFAEVVRLAGQHLAQSVPPVGHSAALAVVTAIVVGLVALLLDILFIELRWRVASALALASFALVPALHVGVPQPLLIAGPLAAAALVLASDSLIPGSSTATSTGGAKGSPALAARSLGAVSIAVALAVALAPALTGHLAFGIRPVVPLSLAQFGGGAGSGPPLGGQMVNDSVSVRRTLNTPETRNLFSYATSTGEPMYLRTRVLTRFDGESYTMPSRSALASAYYAPQAPTDTRMDDDATGTTVSVTMSTAIRDRVPVPAGVRGMGELGALDPSVAPPAFGEMGVEAGYENSSGLAYEVVAGPTLPPASELAQVRDEDVDGSAGMPMEVEIPERVRTLAAQVKADAGAESPFETAMAYQEYFQRFDYSLTTVTPAGKNPIDAFLDERVGYCEQFAATFALMMNAEGYPTRVVVGYTGGARVPDAGGDEMAPFQVTNRNAHAWPEVWMGAQYGWVRFEPTPQSGGAGIEAPEGYAPAAQDSGADAAGADGAEAPAPDPGAAEDEAATSGADQATDPATDEPILLSMQTTVSRDPASLVPLQIALAITSVLTLGATAALALRFPERRRRLEVARESHAREQRWFMADALWVQDGDPSEIVRLALVDVAEAARAAHCPVPPGAAPDEALARAQAWVGVDDPALGALVMRALYSPAGGVSEEDVERVRDGAASLIAALRARAHASEGTR